MKTIFLIPLLVLELLLASSEHEFYVSVIEVRHSSDTQSVRCRIRVFSDDLQVGLQSEYNLPTTPPLAGLCTDHADNIVTFFSDHVAISINGRTVGIDSLSCYSDGDVHAVEWQIDSIAQINSFSLTADYLMDIYPDQTQMVQFSSGDKHRTLRLTRKSPSAVIELRN